MTALEVALRTALDAGQVVPCTGPYRDCWTSDDADERAVAAQLCVPCVIFAACAAAADQHDERFGVWAGTDRSERRTPTHRRRSA